MRLNRYGVSIKYPSTILYRIAVHFPFRIFSDCFFEPPRPHTRSSLVTGHGGLTRVSRQPASLYVLERHDSTIPYDYTITTGPDSLLHHVVVRLLIWLNIKYAYYLIKSWKKKKKKNPTMYFSNKIWNAILLCSVFSTVVLFVPSIGK